MTKQQPEALRLAEMLTADEWPGSVTLVSYAQECVAELLRQHAENETVRAGYAAARLEIESLRAAQPAGAQQPGAAYAALSDVDSLAQEIRRVDGAHRLGAGALAEALMPFLRASHGQAPASVLHLVHSAFAEIAMAFPKAFALHKVGIADTAVREALAAPAQPSDPHAELRKAWTPGHKWQWTSAAEEGRWWSHNGEPEWNPEWRYRLAPARPVAEPGAALAAAPPTQPAPQQEAQEPAKLSDEQIKAHGDKVSRIVAQDLTRFDAACEVDKYLREQGAPGYYRHRMSIVLFGNVEGTEAARAPDTAPQPSPAAQGDALSDDAVRVLPETCEWTATDAFDQTYWDSACGEAWTFIDGGPADNSVRFCQGCGKPVHIKQGGQHGIDI